MDGLAGAGLFPYGAFSLLRISGGFGLGLVLGVLLAVAAGWLRVLEILLWPYVTVIKSVPVASFIIICLIWLNTSQLAVFISFLMVFPAIYSNTLQGIRSADPALLEMARLYRVPFSRRLGYIYVPQVKPFLLSGCSVALGMSWKSGVAAEVIGVVGGSIGERLYEAKVYFQMTDLLAWTVVIVVCSVGFEKLVLWLLRRASPRGRDGNGPGNCACIQGLRPRPGAAGREPDGAAGGDGVPDGPSGLGKTTLLRCVAGLETPDAGAVTGVPRRLGYVFQEDRLCDNFSAVANIRLVTGRTLPEKAILQHLEELGLSDSVRLPVSQLSGGMRRRVAIARACAAGRSFCCWTRPSRDWMSSAAGTPRLYPPPHGGGLHPVCDPRPGGGYAVGRALHRPGSAPAARLNRKNVSHSETFR